MDLASNATGILWICSLAAVPLALVVAVAGRLPGCRPATRHALWAAVLASFFTPVLASMFWRPTWFESSRVLAAAERVMKPASNEVTQATRAEPHAAGAPRQDASNSANDLDAATEVAKLPANVGSGKLPVSMPALAVTSTVECEPVMGAGVFGADVARARRESPATSSRTDSQRSPSGQVGERRPGQASAGSAKQTEASKPVKHAPGAVSANVPSATARDWSTDARAWLAQLLNVRDSIARIPPLPLELWGAGSVLVVCCWVARSLGLRRVLRRGRPASAETHRLVEWCAGEMSLPRTPGILMTSDPVSPMIVCGTRPTLLLPSELWGRMDDTSRRAVIMHELAHIRRRDHWWCWVAALTSVVYWWHPVVWWTRTRMRDEADACCDAWVTTVLPGGRRAFAQALVTTKSFLSVPGRCAPPGLGVMSGGAKRLARRVTMVMTQRVVPNSSAWGVLAAVSVAAAGMLVMPSLACPPESEAKASAKHKATLDSKAHAERQAGPKVQFFGEAPGLEAMRARELEAAAGQHGQAGHGSDHALQHLEERLKVLEGQLREMERRAGRARPGIAPAAPRPPSAPGEPAQPTPPARPSAANTAVILPRIATMPSHSPFAVVAPRPSASSAPLAYVLSSGGAVASTSEGPDVVREYRMPAGKLEALMALMERSDVPVLMERRDGAIAIHASAARQEIFAAFVRMISPETNAGADAFGRMRTLDAPRAVTVPGADLYQEKVKDLEGVRERLKQLERGHRDVEREAERLRERSDRARDKEERLREEADVKRNMLGSLTDPVRQAQVQAELSQLASHAAATVAQAEAMDSAANGLEAQVAAVEAEIEALEAMIEGMEAQIEAQAEAQEQAEADLEEVDQPEDGEVEVPTPIAEPAEEEAGEQTPAPTAD